MGRGARLGLTLMLVAGGAAWARSAEDAGREREALRAMCKETLATLYRHRPEARAEVEKAPGYGCFQTLGVTLLLGGAVGRGVVYERATGRTVYLRLIQGIGGLDLGVRDHREVLVFRSTEALSDFVDSGWQFTGDVAAAARAGGAGVGPQREIALGAQITVYPLTRTGLQLGVSAGVRKVWKDATLNP